MCPLKADILFRISFFNPIPVATETNIIMIPMAIADTAIFIIGPDILLLWFLAVISRFAMKYSKFKWI